MLAKPVVRMCIPPSHRKIYFMYICLAQVISKAFVNKTHIKICRCINLNKYIYARLYSLQSCIITDVNCWRDIIIGLIATLKHLYLLDIARKMSFL